MVLLKSEVRENLRCGPCEYCGEHIGEGTNHVLTFFRGSFVILHPDCFKRFKLTGRKRGEEKPS